MIRPKENLTMGALSHFDLSAPVFQKFKVFVETGLGHGSSLNFARSCPQFERLYSTEIDLGVVATYGSAFDTDLRVTIVAKETSAALKEILPTVPKNEKILFWLDAHLPGAWEGRGFDDVPFELRCPLANELETIRTMRGEALADDVILIDDLRIYEDGPFQHGNWPERKQLGGDGIQFIFDCLSSTHTIERDYAHEGYIVCLPKTQ